MKKSIYLIIEIMSIQQLRKQLDLEIQLLMVAQCGWLDAKIPIWEKIINHRHEVSEIPKINFIKEKVIEKIGIIPIFYLCCCIIYWLNIFVVEGK